MRWVMLSVAFTAGLAEVACAQSTGANITLQLPSFSQFGVDTTVVVPDGGRAALAGDNSAAVDSRRWAGARALGVNRQANQAQVTARIHDPQQAEAALRATAGRDRSRGTASQITDSLTGRRATDSALPSVDELARQRTEREAAGDRSARALFDKGRQAQQAGKSALAANYYRTSVSQASPALRQEIERQWRTLSPGQRTARDRAPAQRTLVGANPGK